MRGTLQKSGHPSLGEEVSACFLKQISQTDPTALHVVIQDQADFHRKADSPSRPANVFLLPLPPYSPELNPAERVGTMIRASTANRVLVDLPAMEGTLTETLRPLWTDPARVRRLVGDV